MPGPHLNGLVTRRFLVDYPVPPSVLQPFLPPGGELALWGGAAWLSACIVNIRHMRPSPLPAFLGAEFNYLVHRTRARLPFPDGRKRDAVLIIEANLDNSLFSVIGRLTSKIRFNTRQIALRETADSWRLMMREKSGEALYDASVPKSSVGGELPPGSLFSSTGQADRFIAGVSYGGQWHPDDGRLRLIPETHSPWKVLVGSSLTRRNAFLEQLCGRDRAPQADHAILITAVPHHFPIFGVAVRF